MSNYSNNWLLWCRLCGSDKTQGGIDILKQTKLGIGTNKDIDPSYPKEGDMNLATAIEKYFSLQINNNENLPKIICIECCTKLTMLVCFEERIKRAQQFYHVLANPVTGSNTNLYAMRLDYQLLNEDYWKVTQVIRSIVKEENVQSESSRNGDPLEHLDVVIKKEQDSTMDEFSNLMEKSWLQFENVSDVDNFQSQILNKTNDINEGVNNVTDADLETYSNQKNDSKTIYTCTKCPQKFKMFYHYQNHVKREHFSCHQCPKVFMTKEYLDQHLEIHLPVEQRKIFACPDCDIKFISNVTLQTHIKHFHLKETAFICEQCGETAPSMSILNYHMLTHNDELPFECELCKKKYKHKSILKKHMAASHDNTDHICNECGLQLKCAATLKRHMLVHTSDVNFNCNHCGRGFKRSKTLKCHLLLHTGLKPYSCDFCHLTFANGSNCRTHKKRSHPEQLAAQEAKGKKTFTRNIPKLRTLIATTKTSNHLLPVASKPSGHFAHKRIQAITKL